MADATALTRITKEMIDLEQKRNAKSCKYDELELEQMMQRFAWAVTHSANLRTMLEAHDRLVASKTEDDANESDSLKSFYRESIQPKGTMLFSDGMQGDYEFRCATGEQRSEEGISNFIRLYERLKEIYGEDLWTEVEKVSKMQL